MPQCLPQACFGQPTETKRSTTTIPFAHPDDLRPIIKVKVGYSDALFAVDTGSIWTCITDFASVKFRLVAKDAVSKSGKPVIIGGQPTHMVLIPGVQYGEFNTGAFDAFVVPGYKVALSDAPNFDGIIGGDLLAQLALILDFQKRSITFIYPAGLTDRERAEMGFQDAASLLFRMDNNDLRPYVTARSPIGTDGSAFRKEEFLLDTGRASTVVSAAFAKALGLKKKSGTSINTLYNSAKGSAGNLPKLSLAGVECSDVSVRWYAKDTKSSIPILGMELLSRFRVLIDYPAKKLYLKPVESAPETKAPTAAQH